MRIYFISLWIFLVAPCCLPVIAQDMVPVTVKALEELVFHPVKKVPAQVVTLQNSLLSAEISAVVENVHVQVGDRVVKEQLLVTLECGDYELNKQQLAAEQQALEADRVFAVYQFERSEKLLKSKNVSQELHRRQASGVKKLEAQIQLLLRKIEQADKQISRCTIKAPFTGVIAERLINIGENTAPRTPLIRLIDVDNLEVEIQAPIVVIDNMNFKSLDFIYQKQHYPVVIRAIIPSVETRARHQRVRMSFTDKKALPNAFGIVEITINELHIPGNYLLTRQSKVGIFLLKRTDKESQTLFKAQFYALKDALTGRSALIDLPLDTKVIIEGRNTLSDGDAVIVQKTHSVFKDR